jgi:5'-deoxynucleotidase YfbR-like HD superfamily hydrolase
MMTYSGISIDLFDFKIEDIRIEDIVFGLSNIARFSGQVPFYSVAKHSIHVSKLLPKNLRLSGLLHDASEAYIGDVISPIKHAMKEYLEIEERIMNEISKKWKLDAKNTMIKEADKKALEYEKSKLFFRQFDAHSFKLRQEYRNENQKEIIDEFMFIFNEEVKNV